MRDFLFSPEGTRRGGQRRLYVLLTIWLVVILLITPGFIALNVRSIVVANWGLGLIYAMVIGHFGTGAFLTALRVYMNLSRPRSMPGEEGVPAALVGTIERIAVAIAIGSGISGNQVLVAVGGWLAIKMAANWNRAFPITSEMKREEAERMTMSRSRNAIASLLAGVVSFTLGAIGGGMALGCLNQEWLTHVWKTCVEMTL